jgi:hypothetical protein
LEWKSGQRIQHLVPARALFKDYAITTNWVDKDPRLSINYGAFLHILLKPVPLGLSIRHPWSVARSLQVRDGMDQEKGLMLWLLYNRHASRFLINSDLIICYEKLLNTDKMLLKIEKFLSENMVHSEQNQPLESALSEKVRSLIDPGLERSSHHNLEASPLANYCENIYKKIVDHTGNHYSNMIQEAFDSLPGWIIDQYDNTMAKGLPSLEYLRESSFNQALNTPEFSPETETNADIRGQLEVANSNIQNLQSIEQDNQCLILEQQKIIEELQLKASKYEQEIGSYSDEIMDLKYKLSILNEYLKQIHDTLSWKITSPLRWLRRGFKARHINPVEQEK